MHSEELHFESIPWTLRDVWYGVVFLALWLTSCIAVSLWFKFSAAQANAGLFIWVAESALLIPVWWLSLRKYRVGLEKLGLRRFKLYMLGLGCGLMFFAFMINYMYDVFLSLFNLRSQMDLVPLFKELSSPWLLLGAGVVVAPVVEEVFFRGFLFAGLCKQYGWQKSAFISSALFALIHLQPLAVIPIFFLGYIFAFLYYRSNSIVPAILMHVLTNALGLGAAYLEAKAIGQ